MAKREYAKQIGMYSRDQIDVVMQQLAKLMVSRERDDRIYKEPNLPAILALAYEISRKDQAHKLFLPQKIETQEEKNARLNLGKSEASKLLAMLDVEQEKPVRDNRRELEQLKKAQERI